MSGPETWRSAADIPDGEIARLAGIAARIVDRHGAAYLPIFEALEREEEARRAGPLARARARARLAEGAAHAG